MQESFLDHSDGDYDNILEDPSSNEISVPLLVLGSINLIGIIKARRPSNTQNHPFRLFWTIDKLIPVYTMLKRLTILD